MKLAQMHSEPWVSDLLALAMDLGSAAAAAWTSSGAPGGDGRGVLRTGDHLEDVVGLTLERPPQGRVLLTTQELPPRLRTLGQELDGTPRPVRSALCVPVDLPGARVGLLFALDWREREFSPREISRLHRLASSMAGSVRTLTCPIHPPAAADSLSQEVCGFFDLLPDAMAVMDRTGVRLQVNRAWAGIFGWKAQELIGTHFSDQIHPQDIAAVREVGRRLLRDEGPIEVEHRMLHKNGSYRWVRATAVGDTGTDRYLCLFRDITELRRLDRLKSEFVSTVSHELRTPLTSLRGSIGLMGSGALGPVPAPMAEMLAIASRNAARLVRLVNDILDLERIGGGKMEMVIEPVQIGQLLAEASAAVAAQAAQGEVRIEVEPATDIPGIPGDAHRLRQVVDNLLSNALRFSAPGGTVALHVHRGPRSVRIDVVDKGPGVSPEFRDRVFTRFAQADGSDSRSKGGSGLGLSIAKALVEAHGGRIGFEDTPGGGATFWFELPTEVLPAGTSLADGDAGLDIALPPRPRILVCEDDEECAELLAAVLERRGFDVSVANTGPQAVEMLCQQSFDAATLDLDLPGMEGLEVLRRVQASGRVNLPVVVLSGRLDLGETEANASLGVRCWLSKPIEANRLAVALRGAMGEETDGRPVVLYVEANDELRAVMRAMLAPHAEVIGVGTVGQAIDRIRQGGLQAVVLDAGLPEGGAAEVLQQLSTLAPGLPVVLFSSEEPDPAMLCGVVGSLVKTRQSEDQLVRILNEALKGPDANPHS